jgi:RHS repeat-associated protein
LSSNYLYDANGNLTQNAAGERFAYDQENHQTKFFVSTNGGSTPDATYHYDGEGRRVKKISSTDSTIFVYDGLGKQIAEYSIESETSPPMDDGNFPQVRYLTTDHLGSPRVITDKYGAVLSRKDFTAFGEESITAQRNANLGYAQPEAEVRQNYTGYEKDTESGLEFAQARYYNPAHGRFTSADPLTASASIRDPQTFNRYSYVLNSPYKFVDPLGLMSVNSIACGNSCRNSGSMVDGSVFSGSDTSFDELLDSLNPAFNWANLSADEQRIFNNSSVTVGQSCSRSGCRPDTRSGESLFNYFAENNPQALAGTLNQTAQLAKIEYVDNMGTRSALSLVSSITRLDQDRAEFSVAPALKHFISGHDDFSRAEGHGDSYPDSWKQNKPPYAGAQLSFSREGDSLEVDTDYSNIKNRQDLVSIFRGVFGHAIEVGDNRLNNKKTNPYVVYRMLVKRNIEPNYTVVRMGGGR